MTDASAENHSLTVAARSNDASHTDDDANPGPASRIVLIGASNLTRGISTVVGLTQGLVAAPHELFIAYGHGRSYGVRSSLFFRALPGVLECGMWDDLSRRAAERPAPLYALVTDIGNDILYGYDAPTIIGWVTQTIDRLGAHDARLIVTTLPAFNIDRLSAFKFGFFRRLFCPTSTLTLEQAQQRTHDVNDALRALAAERGFALIEPRPDWYGVDPIHYPMRHWKTVWGTVLASWSDGEQPAEARASVRRWVALRKLRPQRRWLFRRERYREQPSGRWSDDYTAWVY